MTVQDPRESGPRVTAPVQAPRIPYFVETRRGGRTASRSELVSRVAYVSLQAAVEACWDHGVNCLIREENFTTDDNRQAPHVIQWRSRVEYRLDEMGASGGTVGPFPRREWLVVSPTTVAELRQVAPARVPNVPGWPEDDLRDAVEDYNAVAEASS